MDEPPSYTTILTIFSGHGLSNSLGLVVIVLLLLMSALASASEAAFFSLQPEDLEKYRTSKDQRESIILGLLKNSRILLATILTVNALVKVSVVVIGMFLLGDLVDLSKGTNATLSILSIIFVLTFFGELSKVYGAHKNAVMARRVCGLWRVLVRVCKPSSLLLIRLGNIFGNQSEGTKQTSAEELNEALELAVDSEHTTEDEKEILRGIVNFGSLRVKQLMRPRAEVSAVAIELNFHELIDALNKSGFSRIPVFRGTIDKIEGVLYIKDLLPFLKQPKTFEWQKLLRPGFFVPEQKKLDSLLKDFQEKRVHMAMVVNESNRTAGLITLEDIIEEIIGDINDEFDDVALNYQKTDDQ